MTEPGPPPVRSEPANPAMLHPEAAEPSTGTSQSLRVTLWVLLIVYIFNFIDRQIVNILAEPISKELGLTDTQIGLMTGLAFALFYTVLGLPIARFADRPSTNRVGLISAALAIWSAMTVLCGFAQNFTQLLLARIGVGVGEAGCTPAAHSLIADKAPPAKRASAMAFYAMGIPIGGLLGMVIGGLLADQVGWRMAFVWVGAPGILLALAVLFILKDPRRHDVITRANTPEQPGAALQSRLSTSEALAQIFRSRALVLLLVAGALSAFLSYGKTTWQVIFFQRTHELSPGETGLWLGLSAGLAAILGTWLGGWLADKHGKDDRRHVLTAPAIGMLLAAPILFAGYVVSHWYASLALLAAATLLNSLYYGPLYSSVQGLVQPQARAMASAVLLFAQNLIGLGLGPLFFGMLSDYFKPMAGDESVRWVLFAAAWLGVVPAFFFWRASLRLNDELDRKG